MARQKGDMSENRISRFFGKSLLLVYFEVLWVYKPYSDP